MKGGQDGGEVKRLRRRVAALEAALAEHRKTLKALQESEERYRVVAELSPVGIAIAAGGKHIYANKRLAEIFGHSDPTELIGRSVLNYIHPGYRKIVRERIKRQIREMIPVPTIEEKMITADGKVIYTDVAAAPIRYQGRKAVLALIRDITERKVMEEALLESEERYRTIFDMAPDAIFIADPESGNIVDVNPAACLLMGMPRERLIGLHQSELHPPEARERERRLFNAYVRYVQKTGETYPIQSAVMRADGSVVSVEIMAQMIQLRGKRYFCGTFRDVSERRRLEDALRESEERYRTLVESTDDSIYMVDEDGVYLLGNQRYLSRLGLERGKEVGRSYAEFHSPEETHDFMRRLKGVMRSGRGVSYEYQSHRDGRYFLRTITPLRPYARRSKKYFTIISKDITELKQKEAALRDREAFNFALFQYNPVETIVVDREGRVTAYNLAKKNSGDRLPAIGDVMYRDYASRHTIDMYEELMKCITSGKTKSFSELPYRDRYLSITISPFPHGAIIISEDITERRRAENALKEERDALLAILEMAPYGVLLLNGDERTLLVNQEFTSITGYELADIPTWRAWLRRAYPDKRYREWVVHTWQEDMKHVTAGGVLRQRRTLHRAFKVTCRDGSFKIVEFRPVRLPDGNIIVMLADITERNRMHQLLERAAAEWRSTFDAIGDAVCILDSKGKIKRCNRAMLQMVGMPASRIVGRHCWDIMHDIGNHPIVCPLTDMQAGKRRECELLLRNGRWFKTTVDPIFAEDETIIGAVHITSDITESLLAEAELEASKRQLRELTRYLQKIREEERTRVAREIHDELAQALTAIKMDLSWLGKRIPSDDPALSQKLGSMVGLVDDTIQSVKRIAASLRPGVLDDLGLVAAIEWQAEEFKQHTGIRCSLHIEQEQIVLDRDLATALFRIFQETLTNVARHSGATAVDAYLYLADDTLVMRVVDNGRGITEEELKDPRSFGLIGMRERVIPWGGEVKVKGLPGQGTTVEVTLPFGSRSG